MKKVGTGLLYAGRLMAFAVFFLRDSNIYRAREVSVLQLLLHGNGGG